jgi:hypothetical protein
MCNTCFCSLGQDCGIAEAPFDSQGVGFAESMNAISLQMHELAAQEMQFSDFLQQKLSMVTRQARRPAKYWIWQLQLKRHQHPSST